MDINIFFWINLLLGLFFVFFFWTKKKSSLRPTLLNMKTNAKEKNLHTAAMSEIQGTLRSQTLHSQASHSQTSHSQASHSQTSQTYDKEKPMRDLNVIFMWNGEPWDAYEILGIPAGSRLEVAEKAFHHLKSTSSIESLPFYEAAFQALMDSRSNRD